MRNGTNGTYGQDEVAYQFEAANVQALLLNQGFAVKVVRYCFVELGDDLTAARAWLAGLLVEHVLDMAAAGPSSRATVNVAFTAGGLRRLGVEYLPRDRPWDQGRGEPFEMGMAKRSVVVNEVTGPDDWDWDATWREDATAQVLVWISAADTEALETTFRAAFGIDPSGGPRSFTGGRLLDTVDAATLADGYSHFGFRDGVSQPFIREVHDQDRFNAVERQPLAGSGVLESDGSWRGVELGEFLLGYPGEWLPQTSSTWQYDGPRAAGVRPDFFTDGTFVVWRKLEQHVDRYAAFLDENVPAYAALNGWSEDEARIQLAARVVGRYPFRVPERRDNTVHWTLLDDPRSGRPLATDLAGGTDDYGPIANSFRYSDDDGTGRRCPFSAHMRRANPRDGLAQPRLTSRHRLIRRSYPYGTLDTEPQGLIFVGICSDIEDQFEFIKRDWLNDGRPFEQGATPDPIGGTFTGHRTWVLPGPRTFVANMEAPLLTLRGGDYFFAPSIRALGELAGGADPPGATGMTPNPLT